MDCPSSDVLIWFLVLRPAAKERRSETFPHNFCKVSQCWLLLQQTQNSDLETLQQKIWHHSALLTKIPTWSLRSIPGTFFFNLLAPLGAPYGLVLIRSKHIVVFTQPMNVIVAQQPSITVALLLDLLVLLLPVSMLLWQQLSLVHLKMSV